MLMTEVSQLVLFQSVEVNGLTYKMDGLNKFTEYTVRVLALNRYGPSPATEAASVTTHSDGERYRANVHQRASCTPTHPCTYSYCCYLIYFSSIIHLIQFRTRFASNSVFHFSFSFN